MPLVTARVITAKVVAAFHEQFESFVIIYIWVNYCPECANARIFHLLQYL